MDFIRSQAEQGRAVESVCRVLSEQGLQVAARTYRAWRGARTLSERTLAMAYLMDAVHTLAYVLDDAGRFRLRPEGLYGRRKMTALLRRQGHEVSYGRVDAAMKALRHNGIRRARRHRTTVPAKDGVRARDLLNRDFTAAAPNRVWVTDFTYSRTWAGFVYVSFIVDVYAQRVVAWHASTSKVTDLVMTPLRMAIWQRDHEGHPVARRHLIHHSNAGSQYTSIRLTEHLALEEIAASIGTVGDSLLTGQSPCLCRSATRQCLVVAEAVRGAGATSVARGCRGRGAARGTRRGMEARRRGGCAVRAGERVPEPSAGPELLARDGSGLRL